MSTLISKHVSINNTEFRQLQKHIYALTGINMASTKRELLENRLQKRLRKHALKSFTEYIELLHLENSTEESFMIDEVTTNKTYFFRESDHFKYFTNEILPQYVQQNKKLKIWSNACSTGEEVYTLSIVLQEYIRESNQNLQWDILGTDISNKVIKSATRGVYAEELIIDLPKDILSNYFLRSVDRKLKLIKVADVLKQSVEFRYLNLIDENYSVSDVDVIFCRNVLIYFDREIQEAVVKKMYKRLNSGGYIILSHSESILGFDIPLKKVGPSIYQKL